MTLRAPDLPALSEGAAGALLRLISSAAAREDKKLDGSIGMDSVR
jgi:hypothetical protein